MVHDNLLNLDHDMVSPAVFRLVLNFIYTGRLADGAEAAASAAVAPGAEPSLGAVLARRQLPADPRPRGAVQETPQRHGKYCHLRGGGGGGGGYAPYGRPGQGLRAATPVIQACYSSRPGLRRRPRRAAVGPEAAVNAHCAELYASGPGPAASLCCPERCSRSAAWTCQEKPAGLRASRATAGGELPRAQTAHSQRRLAAYKEPPLTLPPLPPLPFQKLEEAGPPPDPFQVAAAAWDPSPRPSRRASLPSIAG